MLSISYITLSLCTTFSLTVFSCEAYQDMMRLRASTKSAMNDPFAIVQKSKLDKAVVLFHKPSCPFCVYIKKDFEALAKKNKDKAQFIMLDIQQDKRYPSTFGFSTVPTVVYFKNGKAIAKHGSNNKSVTLQYMQNYVNKLA